MRTFLDLVQATARESGTVPDPSAPATVVGQTGRLARFVHWVRDAYLDVQRHRDDWRWMRHRFEGILIPGVQEYDGAAFGLDRWASWVHSDEGGPHSFTIQKVSEGRGDEGWIGTPTWDAHQAHHLMGSSVGRRDRPSYVGISPQDRLVFWPTPDAPYIVRGEYKRAAQVLVVDADVLEMPGEHQDAIKWRALILMATFDESFHQEARWTQEYRRHIGALERKQLPRITFGGPLA